MSKTKSTDVVTHPKLSSDERKLAAKQAAAEKAAALGPVLPSRCDECIGGVAMETTTDPREQGCPEPGEVSVKCPKCGRLQYAKRLKVGDGATRVMITDRFPYTVVEILSETRVVVQADAFERTDANGMSESQSYRYTSNPTAPRIVVKLLKTGWTDGGGARYALGFRRAYHDFSF